MLETCRNEQDAPRRSRIPVDGKPFPHAFTRDGEEVRVVSVEVDATAGKDKAVAKVTGGMTDLLVLKSTGSAFEGFVRDEVSNSLVLVTFNKF